MPPLSRPLLVFFVSALAGCASPESPSPSPAAARKPAAPAKSAPSANTETLRGYWALYKKDDPQWPEARAEWLAMGEGDAWILVENLLAEIVRASDQGDARALSRARSEMAAVSGPAVPFLVEALEHGDNVTRRHCSDALVAIGPKSVPALLSRLPSYGAAAKRAAAAVLGSIGDPSSVPGLAALARDDADWAVRAESVAALGAFFPATDAEAAIARTLESDPDAFVRRRAAETSARGASRAGADALAGALADADASVRASAASALAARRDPAAVEPLIAALEREAAPARGDASARRAIHGALRELTGADCGFDAAAWRRAAAKTKRE